VGSITSWINTNLGSLVSWAQSIGSAFKDFMKDPVGKIQSTLAWIWANIPSSISNPLGALGSWLGSIGQGIIDFIKDPVGKLRDLGSYIWSITPDFIKSPLSGLAAFVGSVGQAFLSFAKDPIGAISGVLKPLTDALSGGLSTFKGYLDSLGGLLKAPVDAISAGVGSILSGDITKWIADSFTAAVKTLGDAFVSQVVDPVSKTIQSSILDPLQKGLTGVWSFLISGANALLQGIQTTVIPALQGALKWITDSIGTLISDFYNGIKGAVDALSGTAAQDIGNTWPKIVGSLAVIPMTLGLGLSLAQTKAAGFGLDLTPIAGLLHRITDPNLILSPVLSAAIGTGVGIGIQRYYNRKNLPSIPQIQDAYTMFAFGSITQAELYDIGSSWGYSQAKMDDFLTIWDWSPNLRDAILLGQYVELDDPFITEVINRNRIPSAWVSYVRSYLSLRPLRTDISAFIGAIMSNRGVGYLTQEAFTTALTAAQTSGYIRTKEVALRQAQASMVLANNILDQQVSTERYKFRKGLIDAGTLEADLISLGLDPLMANAIKENEEARAGAPGA
jgi:hypothetical protein